MFTLRSASRFNHGGSRSRVEMNQGFSARPGRRSWDKLRRASKRTWETTPLPMSLDDDRVHLLDPIRQHGDPTIPLPLESSSRSFTTFARPACTWRTQFPVDPGQPEPAPALPAGTTEIPGSFRSSAETIAVLRKACQDVPAVQGSALSVQGPSFCFTVRTRLLSNNPSMLTRLDPVKAIGLS